MILYFSGSSYHFPQSPSLCCCAYFHFCHHTHARTHARTHAHTHMDFDPLVNTISQGSICPCFALILHAVNQSCRLIFNEGVSVELFSRHLLLSYSKWMSERLFSLQHSAQCSPFSAESLHEIRGFYEDLAIQYVNMLVTLWNKEEYISAEGF